MNFKEWAKANRVSLKKMFPTLSFTEVIAPNMSTSGNFFEEDPHHEDLSKAEQRLNELTHLHPDALFANGYMEQRSFYNTQAYERTTPTGTEYRNIHLGTDFWVPAQTPVHTPFTGRIVISFDNNIHKDYGPTLVLEHRYGAVKFYTLYGHLSRSSLRISGINTVIPQGERIGFVGDSTENGHWVPHLHFQLITDLLGETKNFKGVAYPSEIALWKDRCPDPNLIFTEFLPSAEKNSD
jgi:murein DD-endopeptidase MepM/ murein hydrolase activator NlpD